MANQKAPLADRRRGADALALPRHRHHRGLPFGAPRRALHRIGAKARLIPEVDISLVSLGLPGNRWVSFPLPARDRLGVTLIGALQRFLRRQSHPRQQRSHRRQTQYHAETLGNKVTSDLARPQAKVETVLHRVLAVDPTKDLMFLSRCEAAWSSAGRLRRQCLETATTSACRLEPAIDRAAVHAETGDHITRPLAFANTLDRHLADRFQRRVIEGAAISLHLEANTRTSSMCCLTY